jgi:hypothetical protein
MSRWSGPENRRALWALCVLVCVAVLGSSPRAEGQYDGTYTGKRVLIEGAAANDCPAEDNVTVTIKGMLLKFTNSELAYEMTLEPAADGSFHQTTVSGGTTVNIQGRITQDTLDADVVNFGNRCKHHWHLTKQS